MKFQRVFYSAEEALRIFDGSWDTLRELVEFHGVCLYVKCKGVRAEHWDEGIPWEDTLASAGSHERAQWSYYKGRPAKEDTAASAPYYYLSGWFEVEHEKSIELIESGRRTEIAVYSYVDGRRAGEFHALDGHEDGLVAGLEDARFKASDVDRYAAILAEQGSHADDPRNHVSAQKQDSDRPLDERERTSLLCIIGALAHEQKLDLSQPFKAGETIAAMMPDVKISGRTIGEHLKAVGAAMESRRV